VQSPDRRGRNDGAHSPHSPPATGSLIL
jgi:hypothetical protein